MHASEVLVWSLREWAPVSGRLHARVIEGGVIYSTTRCDILAMEANLGGGGGMACVHY